MSAYAVWMPQPVPKWYLCGHEKRKIWDVDSHEIGSEISGG